MSEPKVLSPEEKKAAAEKEVDALVKNGLTALDEFANFDQEKVDYIVAKMSVAGLDHHASDCHLRRFLLSLKRLLRDHRGFPQGNRRAETR